MRIPVMLLRFLATVSLACGVALNVSTAGAQSAGPSHVSRLAGKVISARDSQPVAEATVRILGTSRVTRTDRDGIFSIQDAPEGIYTIEASKGAIGKAVIYDVRLIRGAPKGAMDTSTVMTTLVLSDDALRIHESVDAASTQSISLARLPYLVARVGADELVVPTTSSAIELLSGRVAGVLAARESGAPGANVALSVRAPRAGADIARMLYVVDGVMLNNAFPFSTQDLESLDIESIQVVKGVAALAYYGTRAAAGAIVITSRRSDKAPFNRTQFTLRNEIGQDNVAEYFETRRAHSYRLNDAGDYINAAGQVVPRAQRSQSPGGFSLGRYRDPVFDHADQIFEPGGVNSQTVSIQHNRGWSNVGVSYSRNQQRGVVPNADGYMRQTLRANADAYLGDRVRAGATVSYVRGAEEPAIGLADIVFHPPDVDLLARDSLRRTPYVPYPVGTFAPNPLASQLLTDRLIQRRRMLVAANVSYRALSWLTFDVRGSYDHGHSGDTAISRSFLSRTDTASSRAATAIIDTARFTWIQGGATARRSFGKLDATLSARGEKMEGHSGFDLQFYGVKGNPPVRDSAGGSSGRGSFLTQKIESGVAELQLNHSERYAANLLFRTDDIEDVFLYDNKGLISARAGVSWVASQEPWFPLHLNGLVKFRYAYGHIESAKLRPFSFGPGGPFSLVDRQPFRAEHEVGVDASVGRRGMVSLTFARARIQSAITTSSDAFGFPSSVFQYGSKATSLEATAQWQLARNPTGVSWDVVLTADRRRNKVTDVLGDCYTQLTFSLCEGANINDIYGRSLLRDKSKLPDVHANSTSAFDVNDEGFVVPVGTGNTWRDGVSKQLWGTNVTIDGTQYRWGIPIGGSFQPTKAGDGNPDVHFGLQNNMRFKGVRFYTLFDGQLGGDVLDQERAAMYRLGGGVHRDLDQLDKPLEEVKPAAYYQMLGLDDTQTFVTSATHLRLAAASLGYTLNSQQHSWMRKIGASSIQIDLIGRNLFTISNYDGISFQRRLVAPSAAYELGYPPTRTFTLATSISF